MSASHNEPAISQPAPTDTNTEFVNVLEVENKVDEKQATDLLIMGIQTQSTWFSWMLTIPKMIMSQEPRRIS